MADQNASSEFRRREFLQKVLSTALVGAVAQTGLEPTNPTALRAQTNLTPDAALQELVAGNQRFSSNQLTSIEHDLAILKDHTVAKQEPFAGVLSCAGLARAGRIDLRSDHRAPLCVARVAGNIITPEITGSLEYGVAVLGIKALLVLGHANCGAVKAAMKADPVPGQISSLYPHLRPAWKNPAAAWKKPSRKMPNIKLICCALLPP